MDFFNSKIKLKDLNIEVPFSQYLFMKESIPEEHLKKYAHVGKLIGEAMWTVPHWYPANLNVLEILGENWDGKKTGESWTIAQINENITTGFYDDNEQLIKELLELLSDELPSKYEQAFDEMKFAFSNEKYILCAAALFILIDGLTQDANGYSKVCSTFNKKSATDNKGYNPPAILGEINAINKFLNKIYSKVNFDNFNEITLIENNRHTFLHGKKLVADKLQCVRLLNCAFSVFSVGKCVSSIAKKIHNSEQLQHDSNVF